MEEKNMREYCREITRNSLKRELDKILVYYMAVYDEYYETFSRDSAFLKDLVDGIQGISAVLEVYVEQKGIHPEYAIEKLNFTESYVRSVRKYFESKLEEEENNERE